MYLAIDVGGTKTLAASLTNQGVIKEEFRFLTPASYDDFLKELTANVDKLTTDEFRACGIGIPGIVDHKRELGVSFGNLKWRNIPIHTDMERIAGCPVVVENDAKMAGLSEAMLVKQYHKVLYVTVSTGIGVGYIVGQRIDPELSTNEGGSILLEHQGKYRRWEEFASGSAIVRQFGKKVEDINDQRTLRVIARNIAVGLIDLIAILTPEIVVIGGSVGTHYDKYADYLHEYLEKYDNPMIQLPVVKAAERPERAVIYGCYDAARQQYG
jgi:predicted NBD/HSP70 family sugar kinase